MEDALLNVVLARLDAVGLDDHVWPLVLAACEGPDTFAEALGGRVPERPDAAASPEQSEPAGAYLASISVEGFRGVGPKRTLELTPGPGLTLVVGRNGSGKSSFAEGLEVLLTGDSRRWKGRKQKAWQDGWRNLHVPEPASVEAEIVVEGTTGTTRVRREWTSGENDVGRNTVLLTGPDGAKSTLDALGWSDALETYRPFLSYNELGSILDEGPAALHDALAKILGLDELTEAQLRLAQARKDFEDEQTNAKAPVALLRVDLGHVDDERAARCAEALSAKDWDLATIRAAIAGSDERQPGGALEVLRRLTMIEGPSPEAVDEAVAAARDAATRYASVAGTEASVARRIADLLETALEHHDHVRDGECPVCGVGTLDDAWRERAQRTLVEQRSAAEAATKAKAEVAAAADRLRRLVADAPDVLALAPDVGVDALMAEDAWRELRSIETGDLVAAAGAAERAAARLHEALEKVRAQATDELRRREDVWLPLAERLAEWLPRAERALERRSTAAALKAAEKWLKGAADEIRNERLEPLARRAGEIWNMLRQQSSVELGPIRLTGVKTSRRATLDVKVDGKESVALSVMSQGELHSLALSMFLPRATVPESPFRFLVIDDPVQAMDPAKVDGLARVFDEVAKSRQVVVFTHDDRLPEAVRRLGISATVLEVTRQVGSVVTVTRIEDPASRHIDDAMALARTDELPDAVRQRVVPGFCRLAVEAILTDIARRALLRKGVAHEEVEQLIAEATTLNKRLALALFQDVERVSDAHSRIGAMYGKDMREAFFAVNKGAHDGIAGDLVGFVRRVEQLVDHLRRQL